MNIQTSYLLFIGDESDPLRIKMARSAAQWCPEKCVGELPSLGCKVSTGLPTLTIQQAINGGAKTLVLGFANSGGTLEIKYLPQILQALEAGMDIVSGLHDRLADIPAIGEAALRLGRKLVDIRHSPQKYKTGTGLKRAGKRLLTVGTDCSSGKMYTSLSLHKAMELNGIKSTFRATGQCGILVSGNGIAIDCVVADFISGAVEQLAPENDVDHWDIIEGQGSLSHPAFSGVSLGLLHGAQADAIVVCHALGRQHMRGLPHQALPSIAETIRLNEQAARLTNPAAKVVGVSINTSSVSVEQANILCAEMTNELGLPCFDPLRHGVGSLLGVFI
ncbi:MAG: putative NAD-dependent epimerase/dehydratase family protein [Paraglaciecola sp.]